MTIHKIQVEMAVNRGLLVDLMVVRGRGPTDEQVIAICDRQAVLREEYHALPGHECWSGCLPRTMKET